MIRFGIAFGLLLGLAPCAVLAACTGDCNADGEVTIDELLTLASIDLGTAPGSACAAGGVTGTITIGTLVAAAGNALDHCPLGSTPLGTRHFVINPSRSSFKAVLGAGLAFDLGSFVGQDENGQTEPAFLDLEAAIPDVATGVATINVVNASKYIVASSNVGGFGVTVCVRPIVPALSAGRVGCKGGFPFSFETTIDHDIGLVGVNGFTVAQCESTCNSGTCGHVESPNQICAAGLVGVVCRAPADCDTTSGAGDGVCGLRPSMCTAGIAGACQSDADCDSSATAGDGVCGMPEPHPGVCNGPIVPGILASDTGPGEVIIAPNEQFGLTGLPVELLIENAPPCGDEGLGERLMFGLTSGVSRSTILDFDDSGQNGSGQKFSYPANGQNFSCADWQDQNGPGSLVLSAPVLHLNPLNDGDIVTVFTFDGAP
jgi:hypothetical protein